MIPKSLYSAALCNECMANGTSYRLSGVWTVAGLKWVIEEVPALMTRDISSSSMYSCYSGQKRLKI